jgi:ABC-type branched-subunit amino acid transport system substrate-binding protein
VARSRLTLLGGALLGVSLVAAGCGGGSGDGGSETAGTVDSNVKEGVKNALESTTVPGATATTAKPRPTTMADWEKLWETERAETVKRIKDAGAGKSADGKTVKGTGDFVLDLSKCPSGWSDTEGLTDTEIKIGHTTAQSGTLADYGNIARVMQLQAEELNAKGGIKDSTGKTRKVNYIIKDDGYDATRTIPLVDELIDSAKVFGVITLGSPMTMKTYDKLNQRCIPNPFAQTGHPAWGDPVNHPWTTGHQLAYNTEAVLWGAFIEQRIDEMAPNGGKATIAALIMNNDFGKSYDAGFKAYLAGSPIKDRINYVTETIEPQAPTVTDPMTTLASKNPAMFIAMVAGTPCTQAIQEAANNGMNEKVKYKFQPSVCGASTFVGKDKVGNNGAEGWWIVQGGVKDLNSPAFDNDAYIKYAREQLKAAGLEPKSSGSFGSGYFFAWAQLQALQIAAQLDGGLTRSNLIIAIRGMDMTHPFTLDGIRFNMNGNKDAYLIEGGILQTRDVAKETWIDQGKVIDLSGKSKNCAWNQSTGLCA